MVLLFTTRNERFTSIIEGQIKESSLYKFNLDADSLKETFVSITNDNVVIKQGERTITLSQISGVWIKRQSVLVTSEEDLNYCGFHDYCNYVLWRNEWNSVIKQLIVHLSFLEIPFFDEVSSLANAEKKVLQLDIARSVGFNIPSSIVSNSKSQILEFLNNHNNEGILKLSTQPSFNTKNGIYFIYANKVSGADFKEMDTTINSPFIIQNYIEKQFEVRYTFINGEHFVCKIDSQLSEISKIDFRRYDFANTPYTAIDAPDNIRRMVTSLMNKLNLNYGALDFIVDRNGDWFFLEVNPVGQYGWIEYLTGLTITKAILHYLQSKKMV